MKINWQVRIKNKLFWLAFIPALLVLIKSVANVFGIEIDLTAMQRDLLDVVESVFLILGIVGIVADPTTEGLGDSENALTYEKPKK
jgi:phi LC3 family holin